MPQLIRFVAVNFVECRNSSRSNEHSQISFVSVLFVKSRYISRSCNSILIMPIIFHYDQSKAYRIKCDSNLEWVERVTGARSQTRRDGPNNGFSAQQKLNTVKMSYWPLFGLANTSEYISSEIDSFFILIIKLLSRQLTKKTATTFISRRLIRW